MTLFQSHFSGGQQLYYHLLKVGYPGTFQVSPARVQSMYQPEFLATSDKKQVVIP